MAVDYGHQGACCICSASFIAKRYAQKTCSYKCGNDMQNHKKKHSKKNMGVCARCGGSLINRRLGAIYCSKTCKSMDHTFKHRSKTRTTSVARRHELWLRDEGICYICKSPVAEKKFELDHLIPVHVGGSNEATNLAVACLRCNRSRGTRINAVQLLKTVELVKKIGY